MATYNSFEQRRLDQESGRQLDAQAARFIAKGKCPHCGGEGRILWGCAGETTLRSRTCEPCRGSGKAEPDVERPFSLLETAARLPLPSRDTGR